MTNLVIQNIAWQKQNQDFNQVLSVFNKITKKTLDLPLKEYKFNFNLSEVKYCTGFFNGSENVSCKFNNQIKEFETTCAYCENLNGFKSSFIFGDLNHAKANEILSKKYLIYLAYFLPGIIKVGTANILRSNLRLLEQDALVYTFLGESSGFVIQKLEHLISKQFKITEFVSSKHKYKYLSLKPNLNSATSFLNSFALKIKDSFKNTEYSNVFYSEFTISNFLNRNDIFYPNSYKKLLSTIVVGNFKGIRGKYLIIENNLENYCIDVNYLIGREIKEYIDVFNYKDLDLQISLL